MMKQKNSRFFLFLGFYFFGLFLSNPLKADLIDSIDEINSEKAKDPEKTDDSKKPEKTTDEKENADGPIKGDQKTNQQPQKKGDDKKKNPPSTDSSVKKPNTKKTKKKNINQDEQSKLPVHFESEDLSGIRDEGFIELHRKVKVNQGDFDLRANKAKVFFDNETEEVKTVEATGDVKINKIDPMLH